MASPDGCDFNKCHCLCGQLALFALCDYLYLLDWLLTKIGKNLSQDYVVF